MQYVEVAPENMPDPRVEALEKLREMPVPAMTLIPQPHAELSDLPGIQQSRDSRGISEMSVSFSYTLIRNPEDRSSPENLTTLDEDTKRALDEFPSSSSRPEWLTELTEQLRYPRLWEAVRTSWFRDETDYSTPDAVLVEHVNHVLRNSYRAERGLEGRAGSLPPAPDVTTRAVQHHGSLTLEGVPLNALVVDTDPHVYAIGATTRNGGIVTVVLPREEIERIQVELQAHLPTVR
ncbi:hypothetical protein QWJ90_12585 [Microbacterium oryzae]|uniref:hypothetical protein n=1 Tax=Microbacterium oryzae TaxID=743009 RepID=UPI0025B093F3|nr:hypothetical protein [Microbacterium oryzae]MDN3311766.1 hypothetical protein [Microbacterium oryzae]